MLKFKLVYIKKSNITKNNKQVIINMHKIYLDKIILNCFIQYNC